MITTICTLCQKITDVNGNGPDTLFNPIAVIRMPKVPMLAQCDLYVRCKMEPHEVETQILGIQILDPDSKDIIKATQHALKWPEDDENGCFATIKLLCSPLRLTSFGWHEIRLSWNGSPCFISPFLVVKSSTPTTPPIATPPDLPK